MLKNLIACLALSALLLVNAAYADIRPASADSIYSKVLKEQRKLQIHLPLHYDINKAYSYPVLYLLDGPSHINHTTGALDYLVGRDVAPQLITVAITNTKRQRDFTPTKGNSEWGESGGAEAFLDFIETELAPYIDGKYRTKNYKLIAGHSLGGLLVMHSLQTRPHLFQAHFAFSPTLSWGDGTFMKKTQAFFDQTENLKSYLYMNMGNEGLERGDERGLAMRNGIKALTKQLKQKKPKGFVFKSEVLEQESHATTPLIGQVNGFRSLYAQWALPWQKFEAGLTAINQHYQMVSQLYGYQIVPFKHVVNGAGYFQLFQQKDADAAVALFETNVKNYPNCSNCYDSLADGYEKQGKISDAVKQMDLALKLTDKTDDSFAEYTKHKLRLVKLAQKTD